MTGKERKKVRVSLCEVKTKWKTDSPLKARLNGRAGTTRKANLSSFAQMNGKTVTSQGTSENALPPMHLLLKTDAV